jgi:diguanylate cyclase (GGDEF)-like protein/PAS domain S-box-containing protein
MVRLSPVSRICLGLVLLTISIIFAADFIGLIPNQRQMIVASRKKFCESLALQCVVYAQKGDLTAIQATIQLIVERNEDILSAVIRDAEGKILVEAGDHHKHWKSSAGGRSVLDNIEVPIFKGSARWGTVEICFNEIGPKGILGFWAKPVIKLIFFTALVGFAANMFFMKRVLRHLDPASVVPKRVKFALDMLTEGLVLLDQHGRIVMANSAFADGVNKSVASLLGRDPSEFDWTVLKSQDQAQSLPWIQALQGAEAQIDVPLVLSTEAGGVRNFLVNAAPILDAKGSQRGVMATFSDVTQLEERSARLQEMLCQLEESRGEIRCQNQKLQLLASTDPLTGCLNRRSFFEKCATDFSTAQRYGHDISCVMVDIDHFKSTNDCYGHDVGDRVIQLVANAMTSCSRPSDIICRYGGEEFCILLPHTDIQEAATASERFRRNIESQNLSGVRITASFGVSSTVFGATEVKELISQADKALFQAKNSGRNRVACWGEVSADVDMS